GHFGGFQGRVGRLEQRGEPFGFNHAQCDLCHWDTYFFRAEASASWKPFTRSSCGRGMTCEAWSSPTRAAALLPASTAALTLATSPRQMTMMSPPPMEMLFGMDPLAALAMPSVASIAPVYPFVSTIPIAASAIECTYL